VAQTSKTTDETAAFLEHHPEAFYVKFSDFICLELRPKEIRFVPRQMPLSAACSAQPNIMSLASIVHSLDVYVVCSPLPLHSHVLSSTRHEE
jgi:hypothetical protein